MRIWDQIPSIEKNSALKKYINVFDLAISFVKSKILQMFTRNPFELDEGLLTFFAQDNSIELFEKHTSKECQKELIQLSSFILKNKGSNEVLYYLFMKILGYNISISYQNSKQMDISGNIECFSYTDKNSTLIQELNSIHDIASYSYSPDLVVSKMTVTISNYDNNESKLRIAKYILEKYSSAVAFEINVGVA